MTNAAAVDLLHACGLPARWRGHERFVLLIAGATAARAFCTAWAMWRADPDRCERLHVIALDAEWPAPQALALESSDAAVAQELREASSTWPPPTAGLHRLAFALGRVQLLVAAEVSLTDWREIVAHVDGFAIGRHASGVTPLEASHAASAIARLAAPDATLAGLGIDGSARMRLAAQGFRFDASSEAGGAGMARAIYEPTFVPRRPIGRALPPSMRERRVIVIGAGLAGCATAWALAEQGWRCTLIERRASIAEEASGNPAGLFHGIVNGQDGMHARFNRAAALEAQRAVQTALTHHGVRGAFPGLLQLVDPARSAQAMRALLVRLRLPAAYVQALDADQVGALAGLPSTRPAWYFPGGGWVDPRGLAQAFLARAGAAAEVRCGLEVAALHRGDSQWQVLDSAGREIDRASTVVVANAGDALRFVGGNWPVGKVRGQISIASTADLARVALPRLPISGAGYLLPAIEGRLMFGATTAPGDDDPAVRPADHLQNLEQLARLAPSVAAAIDPARLHGRTAWRWVSRDRLPVVGAVPLVGAVPVAGPSAESTGGDELAATAGPSAAASPVARSDQVRFIARQPGLFVFTALGSRGITWGALGAQVLASTITGAPAPVEASLLDALDPARFMVRTSRAASALTR